MWLCLLVAWQLAPGMVAAAPAAPVAPPEVGAVASAPDAPAFAAVFRSSAVPMLLIDPGSGRIVDANPEAAEFYGHTQAELRTRNIQSINTLSPEQVAQERTLAVEQKRNHFIFRHRLANGEVRTVKVHSSPLKFGQRTLLLSVVTDITPGVLDDGQALSHFQQQLQARVEEQTQHIEQSRITQLWGLGALACVQMALIGHLWFSRRKSRHLQRELRATRNHLQATLNAVPDLLFETDADGRFLSVHTSRPGDLLLPPELFLGKHIDEVMPPDVIAMARQAMQHASTHGTSMGHEYHIDYPDARRYFELSVAAKAADQDGSGQPSGFVLVAREISQRKRDEAQLRLAASVFTHAREGILITDAQGHIVMVNDTFTRITGYTSQEVVGQNPRLLKSGRHEPSFYADIWHALRTKGHWYGELWNCRKDGSLYAELLTISVVEDENGTPLHYLGLFNDITAQKEHQAALEHIAHFDALTQLPNRVLLSDRLRQAMVQSQRSGLPMAVVFLDLDGFKAINDQHGHAVGDQLLVTLAQRLKKVLREGDTLARMGGDEFVAVLAALTGPNNPCEPVLTRLLEAASEPVQVGDACLQISASLGVTLYPQDGADAEQLMRHADQAMYQAKQSGKNRYHLFDVATDNAIKSRSEQIDRIHQALRGHEMVLFYQPKVNMHTGQLVGAEALIRWQHPDKGLLAPGHFLPVLEGQALSTELDEWVLAQVFEQLSRWQQQELVLPVGVNISASSLQGPGFVQHLSALQARYPHLPASLIELEVLETSALQDLTATADIMRACREMGVRFALDDFGTGYSSLTYLRRLPADQLKIDQSFVRDMLDDPDDLAIVQGIMGLAAAFRREVIAEGVETQAHGKRLLAMGCELAQGYGIARPMPASLFPAWVANWQAQKSDWLA